MRTSGRPSGSTVARAMALGSLTSLLTASASHSENRATGSSAVRGGRSADATAFRYSSSVGDGGMGGFWVMSAL